MSRLISRRSAIGLALGAGLSAGVAPALAAPTNRADRLWAALMAQPCDRVFVQAHRGDHEYVPENSLRAFESAIRAGVDIVELDVRRTRDGVLVVMHDPKVDRTTTGTGAVSALSFAEIAALRLRGPGGGVMSDRAPTFDQALRAMRGRILVTVDIKVEQLEDVPTILAAVDRAGMGRRVLYYADDLNALDVVHRLDPRAVTLPLASGPDQIQPLIDRFGSGAMHLKPGYLGPDLVSGLQQRNIRTIVNALHAQRTATDDLDAGYDALAAAGVSIIQTNRPSELLAYLRRRRRHADIR